MPYRPTPTRRAAAPAPAERSWIFAGAASLAAVAGYVNVVALGVFHVPVSHMSGAVSRLGIDLAEGQRLDLRLVVGIVLGFFLGAMLSGAVIGDRTLVPGRRYGVTLLLEGALLGAALLLLLDGRPAGVAVAAAACGVQNAMASSYYGLVIRTTHVTGIVTDIGVILGYWVRGRRVRPWKLLLLLGILGGFFVGGLLGAVASRAFGVAALGVAAAGCALAGGGYALWRHLGRAPAGTRGHLHPPGSS